MVAYEKHLVAFLSLATLVAAIHVTAVLADIDEILYAPVIELINNL